MQPVLPWPRVELHLYCTVLYCTAPVLGPRVELHYLRHLRHPGLRGGGCGGDRAGGGGTEASNRLSTRYFQEKIHFRKGLKAMHA